MSIEKLERLYQLHLAKYSGNGDGKMPIIEDILTAPLKIEKKVEEGGIEKIDIPLVDEKEKIESSKERLSRIFKNTNVDALYYGTTDSGEIILGYEEKVDEKTGEVTKTPIVQEKLNLFDNNNLLEIEVELNPELIGKKDRLGLTPEERKRYDRLMAMNQTGNYRSEEEIIRKAKNEQDLDSSIIPDMMLHFLSEKEDSLEELSDEERNDIKLLRRKGIIMEPETVSGFHKSLKLVANDRTVHGVMFFRWLTQKGYTLDTLSEEKAKELAREYRKERRPSLEMLIDATIQDMETVLCESIKDDYKDEPASARELIHKIRTLPGFKAALIQRFKEKGSNLLPIDSFRKIETYFRVYGLNEDDSKQFNPNYISNPKSKITMRQKMDEFEANTGYTFEEVYSHMWEKIEKIISEMGPEKNEKGISSNEVENSSGHLASADIPEGIEFEEDENEDEFDLI